VPFDEFNFFLFGCPSAIAIYLAYCRFLGLPQIKNDS
jgi:hypothetical protein